MTTQVPASMLAADAATKTELDAAIAAEVIARNAAIAAGNVKLSGDTVQSVSTQITGVLTGTTLIPLDDTIPQISEGTEIITRAITPANASNTLEITANVMLTSSVSAHVSMALFVDSTTDAIAAITQAVGNTSFVESVTLRFRVAAGSTTARTYRLRVGPNSAATVTINGQAGTRIFGGVAISSLTITEFAA
jgi:hypothetical protein